MRNVMEIHNNSGTLQALSLTAPMELTYLGKKYANIQELLVDVAERGIESKRSLREINNNQYRILKASLLALLTEDQKLRNLLVSTEGNYLVYRSIDNFVWGTTPKGVGSNKLGVLWEDLRSEFTSVKSS